jgi:hypothetical protein
VLRRLQTVSALLSLSLCAALSIALFVPAAASSSVPIAPLLGSAPQPVAKAPTVSTTTDPNAPVPVVASDQPPSGRRLSSNEVLVIASRLKKMRKVRAEYPGSYGGAYLKGPGRWQVSYFSRGGKKEIGQVIIADATGKVLEQWTGFQVAWTMARGYPGAFGRHVNSLYIWLPLCFLFFVPFIRWRKPFCLLHLDLLVLLSFSVSLAFFNHAEIYASVPLSYPPLIYLLIRMLAIARRSRAPLAADGDLLAVGDDGPFVDHQMTDALGPRLAPYEAPPRPRAFGSIPVAWMAVGVLFLLGFRIGLNIADSNVIDVGYAGVIGAQKIVKGDALYGAWPSNNEHGDTYGPVNYESYVPFEQIFGFSGTWDDLPAAHAAAIFFDLLAVALMFLLGLRLRGMALGVSLAYAWVSYPFTLFALESNSNDTIVAVLLLAVLLTAARPMARGGFALAAGLTKFAPLALIPLLATHGLSELSARRRPRAFALFAFSVLFTGALVCIPALSGDSLHTIYDRTIAYQANRGSPFSVWGLYRDLGGLQTAVQIGAVLLALALAVIPRRSDVVGLAAACAAVIIALQLGIDHWFYLYIPWFFGLVMLALLGSVERATERESPPPAGEESLAVSLSRPTIAIG